MADTAPLSSQDLPLPSPVPTESGGPEVRATTRPAPAEVEPLLADPSRRVGRYVLVSELGAGGMGSVYRAWDADFARWVAVKFLKARDERSRAYFKREAQLAAGLSHPNIAAMYEIGEQAGTPYIAMQLIAGETLHAARRTLTREQVVRAMRDAARAVQAAHEKGIVHRDLKPANLMVERERVYVMDFGLARETVAEGVSLSGDEKLLGTPEYMPPEQARGRLKEVDARSDVYALGATLYELLVGRPPFTSESRADVVMQVVSEEAVAPRKLVRDLPADLETIVLKCLEKEKARRYGSAGELADDLDRYLNHDAIAAHPPSAWYRFSKRVRKQPVQFALGAVLILVVLGGAWFGTRLLVARNEALRDQLRAEMNAAAEAENRAKAEREGRERLADQLARTCLLQGRHAMDLGNDGEAALLCATADAVHPSAQSRAAASGALASLAKLRAILGHDAAADAVFTRDGSRLATTAKGVHLWDTATGRPVGSPIPLGTALAFSAESGRLAVADADTIQLWDTATGDRVGVPLRHAAVTCLAFSRDGRKLVSGGRDTARTWDAIMAQPAGAAVDHGAPVTAAAFSLDGRRVATATDARIVLWDVAGGARVAVSQAGATWLEFSPDGSRLAAAGTSSTACLWDAATGAPVATMEHDADVAFLAYSPDGARIATLTREDAWLWDGVTGAAARKVLHEEHITGLEFSPDGRRLATLGSYRTVRLWDSATGQPLGRAMSHEEGVTAFAFSPDGRRLATAGGTDGTARLSDGATGDPAGCARHGQPIERLAFSPDGRFFATLSGSEVRLWDVSAGGPDGRAIRPGGASVNHVRFSPDGLRAVTVSEDGAARLWDADTRESVGREMKHDQPIQSVAFSPDGTLVATGGSDNTVRFWDSATGASREGVLRHRDVILSLAFSRDGKRLATGNSAVYVWNLETRAAFGAPLPHDALVGGLAFGPDGRLVTASSKARFWDAAGRPAGPAIAHGDSCVALSGDGKRLATGGLDGQARLWDAATGEGVGRPMRHDNTVFGVVFSPDGKRLATASADNTARLWDASTGEPIGKPMRHGNSVLSIDFRADGRRLVTGCADGAARFWDVSWLDESAASEVLMRRAQVDSGLRRSESGELELIPPDEWRALAATRR